jgi:glutathione S-transferase
MAKPVIYGPAYSTFARTVRLALEEKGADYDLVEVDILSGQHKEPAHLARHPFGKVPVFEHDGLVLYDTDAITRYINSAFEGPDLEPANARDQALMTQAIGVMNAYGYPAAMPDAQTCLAALEEMIGDRAFFGGDRLSRADLLLAPVYDYLSQTPEGEKLLAGTPNLRRWWDSLATRPSVEKTRPSLG